MSSPRDPPPDPLRLGRCKICDGPRRFSVVSVAKRDPYLRREILDFTHDRNVLMVAQEARAIRKAVETGDTRALQEPDVDRVGHTIWKTGRQLMRRPLQEPTEEPVAIVTCGNFPDHECEGPFLAAVLKLREALTLEAWEMDSPSVWPGGHRYGETEERKDDAEAREREA